MRFCLYSDCHFSEFSSIIRSQGEIFSTRLENLIASISWAEQIAIDKNCDEIICLGDFFDRSDLNSREITALNEIRWADMPHTYLVGNHDASTKNLLFNSVNVLKKYGFQIINNVVLRHIAKCDLLFVPYFLDSDRKDLATYFDSFYNDSKAVLKINKPKRVVLSHNDIKGLQYGGFQSKNGFAIDDIIENCDLFLNGHLHNSDGKPFAPHAFNLGNLTGQNFSEDASIYSHRVYILDTDAGTLNSIENPYAINFYKLSLVDDKSINIFREMLFSLKSNAVVSIKCPAELKNDLQDILSEDDIQNKIIESRITYSVRRVDDPEDTSAELLHSADDYLLKFITFCKENLPQSDLLEEELSEVCSK